MLKRTHLVIALGVILYFLDVPQLRNKLIFTVVVLISSMLPDLEGVFAGSAGNKGRFFRSVFYSEQKNGVLHSYTVCIIISIFLAMFYPIYAFSFFIGYSFHLFADSFTPQGIQAFWPHKSRSTGHITPGGRLEMMLFYVMLIVDFALLIKLAV